MTMDRAHLIDIALRLNIPVPNSSMDFILTLSEPQLETEILQRLTRRRTKDLIQRDVPSKQRILDWLLYLEGISTKVKQGTSMLCDIIRQHFVDHDKLIIT